MDEQRSRDAKTYSFPMKLQNIQQKKQEKKQFSVCIVHTFKLKNGGFDFFV